MAKYEAISNEEIIAALLCHGTQKAAAESVGLSERALYDRMNKGGFQGQYKAAKADILRQAVIKLSRQIGAAIDTIEDVMTDPDNNPSVRLQAAQTILNNIGKLTQRLQEDEAGVQQQADSNRFDPFA